MDDVGAPHAELVPGSPADEELRMIVKAATQPGRENEAMIRWSSPSVRFHQGLTPKELNSLEKEGICRCTCCSSGSEGFPYAGCGLPIIHNRF